jgi:hypothetical protein
LMDHIWLYKCFRARCNSPIVQDILFLPWKPFLHIYML